MNRYRTGEQIAITQIMQTAGTAINVSAMTVTAVVVNKTAGVISSRVTCSQNGGGTGGSVTATWAGTETATWAPGRYYVEFWMSSGPLSRVSPEFELEQGWPA
jgi:hypothetical protein